jgi:B9 domain-containing protein 1
VVTGSDAWVHVGGAVKDASQRSRVAASSVVWNLPIDCTYTSETPSGWPRLVLTVVSFDWLGRPVVSGYGTVVVPSQPGTHVRTIALYAPAATSWWVWLSGLLRGKRPSLVDPETFLCAPAAGVHMETSADRITVNFHIAVEDGHEFQF